MESCRISFRIFTQLFEETSSYGRGSIPPVPGGGTGVPGGRIGAPGEITGACAGIGQRIAADPPTSHAVAFALAPATVAGNQQRMTVRSAALTHSPQERSCFAFFTRLRAAKRGLVDTRMRTRHQTSMRMAYSFPGMTGLIFYEHRIQSEPSTIFQ